MRLIELLLITTVAVYFSMGINKTVKPEDQQRQEYLPYERVEDTHYIVYEILDPSMEKVADIEWFKKAAEQAIDYGLPNFNILYRSTVRHYSIEAKKEVDAIEGTIQLLPDAMGTDYDAHEILALDINE